MFSEKLVKRFSYFSLIYHTYHNAFIYFCKVFYKWSTTSMKFGSSHWWCIGNYSDVFLIKISHYTFSMHTSTSMAHVLARGWNKPHQGCCKQARRRFSWQKYKLLTLEELKQHVKKEPGRSWLHLGHALPCPLRPDRNSVHPVWGRVFRIAAAWIIFSSNNLFVSH